MRFYSEVIQTCWPICVGNTWLSTARLQNLWRSVQCSKSLLWPMSAVTLPKVCTFMVLFIVTSLLLGCRGYRHEPLAVPITFPISPCSNAISNALELQGGMPSSGYSDFGSQSAAPVVSMPFGGSSSAATAALAKPKGMQLGTAKNADDFLDAMAKVGWQFI